MLNSIVVITYSTVDISCFFPAFKLWTKTKKIDRIMWANKDTLTQCTNRTVLNTNKYRCYCQLFVFAFIDSGFVLGGS